MREEKYSEIEKYLSKNIPNQGIEQKNDFDLCAQAFKIRVEKGSLLLMMSERFVDDNDIGSIVQQFNKWDLPGCIAKNSNSMVLVDNEGIKILKRY